MYKKVTDDWKKNGAWVKSKKPVNQYPDVEKSEDHDFFEYFIAIIGLILLVCIVISAVSCFVHNF